MSGFIKDRFTKIYKNNKPCVSTLGCGLPGVAPKLVGGGAGAYNQGSGMDGANGRSMNRKILRQSFGNKVIKTITDGEFGSPLMLKHHNLTSLTPFRAAMNAGDVNGTVNESTNPIFGRPANQVTGVNPSFSSQALAGYKGLAGNIQTSGNSAYTGNPRFVYDGADYVRFKKLNSINNNYNDRSFGGDQHNASQSALRRVRRY
jgi:hypothetical protein